MQNKVPIVFFDKVIQKQQYSTVVINDYKASFTAVNHLAKKGYRKISGVFGNQNLEITQSRKRGFLDALAKHNLTYFDDLSFHCDNLAEASSKFSKLLIFN